MVFKIKKQQGSHAPNNGVGRASTGTLRTVKVLGGVGANLQDSDTVKGAMWPNSAGAAFVLYSNHGDGAAATEWQPGAGAIYQAVRSMPYSCTQGCLFHVIHQWQSGPCPIGGRSCHAAV